jgi:hypothetical protein
MRDNSADNFIPTLQTVGNMVTLVTLLFLAFLLFIFWIANLSGTRQLPITVDAASPGPRVSA